MWNMQERRKNSRPTNEISDGENTIDQANNQTSATIISTMIEIFFWCDGAITQAVGIVRNAGVNHPATNGDNPKIEYQSE